MEDAPVTAATGALGPVITKLATLLGSEYKLRWRTRRDVKFIRSKLKPVHSILWNIWEREELDEASKALKMEALDLADELEDVIFDFILGMERSRNNKRLVQTKIKASHFQDFKKRASDVSGRCRSKWSEKERPADDDSSPGKPRAYPFVRKDPWEFLGMVEVKPKDELIEHLVGENETTPVELQLKKAFIYGMAGMGKTTLADQVFEAIGSKFQSRAFVSVTPGGNIRDVLARILEQVGANSSEYKVLAGTEASTEEHLIDIISNFLKDKRYLVIVDDIWNWREWGMIMKSLPENNLGSRIVGTTRMKDVAKKWRDDPDVFLHEILHRWDDEEGWLYKIGKKNFFYCIATECILPRDLVPEGFDDEHPIVRMCGGMPLAVRCMLSAVAQEREKQGQHAKIRDVQDETEKHVMENGIQNTPGFEPLVESLQLGYDDLPHHMLKTCLLYCSIYPDGHAFKSRDLVRRWISEGFVCEEEEANSYFEELFNRGLILYTSRDGDLRMHPMMRNFLRCKSRQDNFITCSSEITPSYNNICRIRRLCIDNSPCRSSDAAVDPLSALDWYHIRSLVVDVYEGIERVPLEKLEGVRVLDLCSTPGLQDHHLKDIYGLVRLRHLFHVGNEISGIPPEIVRLQCLETFEAKGDGFARLPGFIGNLQQLKTLEVRGAAIKELPREIGALQQLQTLRIRDTGITVLPKEIGSLKQLKNLDISSTEITVLPKEIGGLQQLRTLGISRTSITVLPKEIGALQQLKTFDISNTRITVLPKEIGALRQLKTFDISNTRITVLPKEIGELQQLQSLDMSHTAITALPKEIGKLQHLEHLLMLFTKVAKIPREIGTLKELKSLKLDHGIAALPLEVCQLSALGELPECIHQAVNKSDLMSKLAREMLSLQFSVGGLVVGAKQMLIPPWIREHFNDIGLLDIRICKLEEGGLKILREMPQLRQLTLRFEVVPREPVVISSEGFAMLYSLTVDSRVPRVTFQEGAMPNLNYLTFQLRFYAGPPNKGPMGINHLRRLEWIWIECDEDWYGGGDSPCIRPTIDVVRKEARELPQLNHFKVCGRWEEEEDMRSGMGEIEEDIQA